MRPPTGMCVVGAPVVSVGFLRMRWRPGDNHLGRGAGSAGSIRTVPVAADGARSPAQQAVMRSALAAARVAPRDRPEALMVRARHPVIRSNWTRSRRCSGDQGRLPRRWCSESVRSTWGAWRPQPGWPEFIKTVLSDAAIGSFRSTCASRRLTPHAGRAQRSSSLRRKAGVWWISAATSGQGVSSLWRQRHECARDRGAERRDR